MAERTVIARRAFARGARITSPGEAIPVNTPSAKVALTRDLWVDTGRDVVEVFVEASLDGGTTWQFLCGFKARGGVHTRRDLTVATESAIAFPLPDRSNPNRRVRVRVEAADPITTEVKLDV